MWDYLFTSFSHQYSSFFFFYSYILCSNIHSSFFFLYVVSMSRFCSCFFRLKHKYISFSSCASMTLWIDSFVKKKSRLYLFYLFCVFGSFFFFDKIKIRFFLLNKCIFFSCLLLLLIPPFSFSLWRFVNKGFIAKRSSFFLLICPLSFFFSLIFLLDR